MIQKKVSMLGAFAVGKTRLVRQFVSGVFSERYQTTIGVKIDKKVVTDLAQPATLLLWDLHGEDELQKVRLSYLRGSAGYFLVVDGTRAHTLETALRLHDAARDCIGVVPCTILVNKVDLRDEWEVDLEALAALRDEGWEVVETSAKTGECIERAFTELTRRILGSGG